MPGFFNYEELSQLHIELTNACNAACPMCSRFHINSPLTRPDLEIEQICIDDFKKWFPPEVIKKCEVVLFCGVHGDPGMARDLFEICEYIGDTNPNCCIRLHTNGGMRKPDWWAKFGELFSKHKRKWWEWRVIFSIDGLEDTNHIYRRNVVWKNLIENVKAFINAGGIAEWDYLIFKHNEHQIAEAKQLSKELGFYTFIPKKALGVDNGEQLVRMPAITREGTLDYFIDAPENPKNRNLENPKPGVSDRVYLFKVEDYKRMKETGESFNNYQERVKTAYDAVRREVTPELDHAEVNCKAKTFNGGKEIFVDNHGRVMPCCYIGTHLNGVHTDAQSLQLHYEMNQYGWDHFNLKNYSLKEILDADHLNKVFADTWNKPSCQQGKLAYCANICGTYSRIDKIYTHDDMEDKTRNWRQN
jgi:MoaA/NifB/PqqE/SkfB family radical SAM enzyme